MCHTALGFFAFQLVVMEISLWATYVQSLTFSKSNPQFLLQNRFVGCSRFEYSKC